MTSSSEPFHWGSRKTIRRGSAKPTASVNGNDLIFDYRATKPSWYCRLPDGDAA
jgi:hypothetical protein